MKKKKQSILSLTALFIALTAMWRATGISWLVWVMVGVTILDVVAFLKK